MDLLARLSAYLPILLQGLGYTVGITVITFWVAFIGGFLLGAAAFELGVARLGRPSWSVAVGLATIAVYVRLLKGIPALTLLFLLYFALPHYGVMINSFWAAVFGLGLIGSAMLTEVFRSGFAALPSGQREAALAAGMTPLTALVVVLLPQIWRVTLPSLANYAIALLKDTAIVSSVAAPEIMFYARNIVTRSFDSATVYLLVATLYFALSFPLARAADALERRARRGRR